MREQAWQIVVEECGAMDSETATDTEAHIANALVY